MNQEIKNRIQEKLDSVDLTEKDLKSYELEKLKDEVVAEMNGDIVLDGVFSDARIFYRKKNK